MTLKANISQINNLVIKGDNGRIDLGKDYSMLYRKQKQSCLKIVDSKNKMVAQCFVIKNDKPYFRKSDFISEADYKLFQILAKIPTRL